MNVEADPLEVLVVGWYPAADDPIAGRFIADQAAALLATGRVRPSVTSFEPFSLQGDLGLREWAVDAWLSAVRTAVREGWAFAVRGTSGPIGVPTLRLGAPSGGTRRAARTHHAIHRGDVLSAVLDGAPGAWRLIHAHVGYPEGAGAAMAARRAGIPFVLTEHATYLETLLADGEIRAAYLAGAQAAARIVAVSYTLAARIAHLFPELSERLVVVPNTVDIDAFRPVGPADRDTDEVLWVGYRREVKGMAVLLEAFRAARIERPTLRLRLVGRSTTEEEEAGWLRLAAQLGVTDAVSFEPPADRAGVAAAMERAALFVHPSRAETMGIVAVEALAAGLPVVAVDSGGVTEVLGPRPSDVGALVPRQEAAALAAAILTTLERRDTFDPARLRAHVVDRFGAAGVATQLADLYDDVLAESSVQGGPAGMPRRAKATRQIGKRRPDGPAVLVSFDRRALDQTLAAFPAGYPSGVVVATAGDPVLGHPDAVRLTKARTDDVAALLSLHGRARGEGFAGLVLAPTRWLRRSIRRHRLWRRTLPALTATIAAAAMRARNDHGGSGPVTLICIGGLDVVASAPLVETDEIQIAPGGPRWLADLLTE